VGRPKAYKRDSVLIAARDVFWERGYEATSISELEQRTGLNRSSLYHEFGSKHELFEAAIECYADQVITTLLADLRRPDARLDAVTALFERLARLFSSSAAVATHGCLLVNTIAELAITEDSIHPAAEAYRDQLRTSFGCALANAAARGEVEADAVHRRAHMLASTLMGIWLAVRIDSNDAAELCRMLAVEVESWRPPPRGPHHRD
jgi:TetR/AcrR family transcriptional regulator, transcriptional repressor for nem operon